MSGGIGGGASVGTGRSWCVGACIGVGAGGGTRDGTGHRVGLRSRKGVRSRARSGTCTATGHGTCLGACIATGDGARTGSGVGARMRSGFGGSTGGHDWHHHQDGRIAIGRGAITELSGGIESPTIGIIGSGDGAGVLSTGTDTTKENATW